MEKSLKYILFFSLLTIIINIIWLFFEYKIFNILNDDTGDTLQLFINVLCAVCIARFQYNINMSIDKRGVVQNFLNNTDYNVKGYCTNLRKCVVKNASFYDVNQLTSICFVILIKSQIQGKGIFNTNLDCQGSVKCNEVQISENVHYKNNQISIYIPKSINEKSNNIIENFLLSGLFISKRQDNKLNIEMNFYDVEIYKNSKKKINLQVMFSLIMSSGYNEHGECNFEILDLVIQEIEK